MLNLAIWNGRGLNKRDHQLAVKDIIAEFRLHFIGLLETRVRINNCASIQSFLIPHWKWFMDYDNIGNRIWIAWDYNYTDVDIIVVGNQFIHCRVTIRALQEYVDITIMYGATEVSDRRELWASLESLAFQCINIPWLVGGDFNAVRDLSEGEWYTWHNRSASPRNLWKRLDRMLTNDTWTLRFPSVFYQCLTPRTSDHSPMVVNGDNQQRFGVTRKLKALKPIFREQRRNKGDLSHNVELARGFLEQAQVLVSSNR
ncbi:uncharacterized protein LOC105179328 [Sesamum indicum]|uniref:Uncharacterized protein LOC105179328 n=1 Tax=Sesamum indicum TaxID=4182 RepID=A0A6I9UL42_SESIN|nr:uncharacterized protein LOC105179328 [Sesamum indicum]